LGVRGISRDDIAENIVKTTTAPKAMAPGAAWMLASPFSWTSVTRSATT